MIFFNCFGRIGQDKIANCEAIYHSSGDFKGACPLRRRGSGKAAGFEARGRLPPSMILGGGPNRIGQGIEFDYCCCHAAMQLKELGYETIIVNCNPETVSTDYDTSDKLYFEPVTTEDVLQI